jgi:hypothetical protein
VADEPTPDRPVRVRPERIPVGGEDRCGRRLRERELDGVPRRERDAELDRLPMRARDIVGEREGVPRR